MKMRLFAVLAFFLSATVVFAGGQQDDKGGGSGFNETGYPIVDEPVTLRMEMTQSKNHTDIEAIPLYQAYQEKTNVNVDLNISSSSGWNEKRNLILASGDLPDVLGMVGEINLATYSNQGVFVKVDEYLDTLAPNFAQVLEERPNHDKAMRLPDGHIYSFPRINELPFRNAPDMMYINTAWLDRLGFEVPANLEELFDVMVAFKENDANGNGDPDDEIPFSFIFDEQSAESPWALLGAWGVNDATDAHLMVEDGHVKFAPALSGYRRGVEWFARLWEAGLIDSEVFTHSKRDYFSKGRGGDEPIYGLYFSWMMDSAIKPDWIAQYTAVPPLPATADASDPIWTRQRGRYLVRDHSAITTASEHVEIAVRFIDGLFERETSLQWARGTFGDVLELKDDGTIAFLDPPPGMSSNQLRFSYAPWILGWAVSEADYRAMDMDPANNLKMSNFYDLYVPHLPQVEDVYPQVFYTPEEAEELSLLQTDLHDYVFRMRAQWVTGEQSIADGWDDYLATLDDIGLQRYLEIQQTAIER